MSDPTDEARRHFIDDWQTCHDAPDQPQRLRVSERAIRTFAGKALPDGAPVTTGTLFGLPFRVDDNLPPGVYVFTTEDGSELHRGLLAASWRPSPS